MRLTLLILALIGLLILGFRHLNQASLNRTLTPSQNLTSPANPILVGAGDIATCENDDDEKTAILIEQVLQQNPSAQVFTTGDNVYQKGTPAEFANCYQPSWGKFKDKTKPAPGNHDYGTLGASGYFDYFGQSAGEPTKGYYSYNLGKWHIVVLNSNCGSAGGCNAGSLQDSWLEADLEDNKTKCTLAYWHHPLFSSSKHGNNPAVKPLWERLYAQNVDVVINGHDHAYERFAPQDPNAKPDEQKGIREFVVGTGGAPLYEIKDLQPNSQVTNNQTFGVLKLTLHESSYDWEFLPSEGQTFTDSGHTNCH